MVATCSLTSCAYQVTKKAEQLGKYTFRIFLMKLVFFHGNILGKREIHILF